jgi:zinc transporter 1/2/3
LYQPCKIEEYLLTDYFSLMDPAYAEIGPNTCVGMTGGWANYSFVAGIILSSVAFVFLMDFAAERYVEVKYGISAHETNIEQMITTGGPGVSSHAGHQYLHSGDQDEQPAAATQTTSLNPSSSTENHDNSKLEKGDALYYHTEVSDSMAERQFHQQIAAFLILEFGVIFHSVIIGLNLGTAGEEFSTLYVVLVFHQSFEGLGIGARLSSIPMPKRFSWLPWALCAAYGLTTPVAIAVGLGLRTTYNSGSFTANVVSGALDAVSAGILMYTALVELLARDFLFNPNRTKDDKRLAFMVGSTILGAGIMALLGKWA